jgi:hypothetical protein
LCDTLVRTPSELANQGLQCLDFYLAEFNHALVVRDTLVVLEPQSVLQRNSPASKLGVFRAVDRFLPIECHSECRAFGRDIIDVPFAAGFRYGIDRGDLDEKPVPQLGSGCLSQMFTA